MPRQPGGSKDEGDTEDAEVDEEIDESFPASDPPSDWGGGSDTGGSS